LPTPATEISDWVVKICEDGESGLLMGRAELVLRSPWAMPDMP
jgi:hypothetical protein